MPEAVYRMRTLLCTLVVPLPVGTSRGLLHLWWMLVSCQQKETSPRPGHPAGGWFS
jgi:hypothetical protein